MGFGVQMEGFSGHIETIAFIFHYFFDFGDFSIGGLTLLPCFFALMSSESCRVGWLIVGFAVLGLSGFGLIF